MWDAIKEYYTMLGEKYSVNPVVFLAIHVLATPPFLFCVAWLIKNIKNRQSILIPFHFLFSFLTLLIFIWFLQVKISPSGFTVSLV